MWEPVLKYAEFRLEVDAGALEAFGDVVGAIPHGFSTHFKQRILSILENPITKKDMSSFIDKYPSKIRVLGYKNDEVLGVFKEKVNSENISLSC